MKKVVLFLVTFLSGVAVMAQNRFSYSSLDDSQTISINYSPYADGDNGSGEISHSWQSSSTNIITEAIYVYSGSDDMSLFQKGSQFALEIEGWANATGTLQTGIVDEQAEAGYWCSNSDYASPEIMITAGEQFTAKFVYTIKQLASEGFVSNDGQFYQTARDIPGLMFRFLMADYDAATEFNNGIAPSEDITNVKKVEFNFTKFTFSYLGDLNQYTKPYVLQNNGVAIFYPGTGYAYQTTFSLAYDNAATTSDFFNYKISGYSLQNIDSLFIALWDASYMATQPYATSLCTDDISGMTKIAAEIKSNEPFQLQGSLPIVRNSNGTENNYNVLLYALSANNELQIILDLEGADEFSIGAELYEKTIDYNFIYTKNENGGVTVSQNFPPPSGDVVIPSEITIEGHNYEVTTIGDFQNCVDLTSITIPESVISIGLAAFQGCWKLKSITIPKSVTTIGENAFDGCSSLTSIAIPENVTTIENDVFYGCSGLTSITIPKNVTTIGIGAFTYCSGLTSITIPESVISIGIGAFSGCYSLTSITIPKSVTTIEDYVFDGCGGLTSITIPESVTSIGLAAFRDCWDLTSITIPKSVTTIGSSAFVGCSSLTSIAIPENVTTIEAYVFDGCGLTSIIIPKNVTTIGIGAFSCSALTSIKVELGNTKYDSRNNCNAIIETATNTLLAGCKNTIIPESVTTIGDGAFNDCSGLTSMTIPENVTTIGTNVFSDLSQVFCSAVTPPTTTSSSFCDDYTATLIVPCDAYDSYKNDVIWGKFNNIECRSLHASDLSTIEITDGGILPTINLSEFFTKAENEEISFEVKSSDDGVVYPVLMGNKLGFVQYGTGTATITVTATVEPISMSKSFNVTINPKPDQPEIPCDLSISSEITNAKCNGVANGKIELSVSGGTEPYQYKWTTGRTSSGIYNVGSGTYSVLVMDDNGCTAMETFSINEPSALAIFETPTNPSCGESNGSIDVMIFGGTEPYSYAWKGTTQTTNVVENLSTGTYVLTVTDGNGCTATKTISLSEQNAPTVTLQSVTASKCNEAMGSIEIAVANGTTPYTYEWSDSSEVANALNRPKMFAGDYTLTVIDGKNCRATLAVTVPPIPFKQPEIALVSYGKQSKHNLIVWKKEQTNEIDKYLIYRETEQNGEYEQIGSQNYNEISVFVDETTNPRTNPNPYRYRISAANKCLESPLSHESKTINLQWKRDENNAIHLWWDAYEGVEYVKFTVYRLTRGGQFMVSEVPANKFRYIAENPEPETMGYFVAVDLIEEIDVTQAMKSESGPFIIVVSNIAELENFVDAIDDIAENQAIVYANGKNIMVNSSEQANVVVFDIAGQLVAQQNAVQSTMIPVKTAGVYVVIVGDKAYKVVVQ